MSYTVAHKARVCRLYRRAIKTLMDWVVDREVLSEQAIQVRNQIERHRHEPNIAYAEDLLKAGEARLKKYAHPDPYILPEMPGGTKWQRNLPVPHEIWDQPYVKH
ncbi:hypothetical protein GUITHDRAFT_155205 [Guillardia theta CCMP2712]|uniref:NADH dehydrogenase [ubiquinone] 1 beta subcomplex subunit 9 n=2 Tax=Guillardia theta TaxID=55529 RepID=L1IK22_GUITC|nr:hypothetical protein GUITHDRAFT_155205 [Guillardia theta CCMP2712]EKX36598.1 hypothetical protein GUITHDRAFT_155205 [Guillardia theta CCMP2712]|mmetsp:Transcript_39338/g.123998  ORF Transcript_39338/g.123998 Transcript_39338/m.123998 type:complete len:105 (+) Transcript_39338:170-484(+)|eukprot:XP_005823578.1 hypothetical protein GUITHDRAFT_155205 [Guillardia theta CCMP2712]